eukprot:4951501-Alexandrium_andersonii.AAC.1
MLSNSPLALRVELDRPLLGERQRGRKRALAACLGPPLPRHLPRRGSYLPICRLWRAQATERSAGGD